MFIFGGGSSSSVGGSDVAGVYEEAQGINLTEMREEDRLSALYKTNLEQFYQQWKSGEVDDDERQFIQSLIDQLVQGYGDAKQYTNEHWYWWACGKVFVITPAVALVSKEVAKPAGRQVQAAATAAATLFSFLFSFYTSRNEVQKYNDADKIVRSVSPRKDATEAANHIERCAVRLCFRFKNAIRRLSTERGEGGIDELAAFFGKAIFTRLARHNGQVADPATTMFKLAIPPAGHRLYKFLGLHRRRLGRKQEFVDPQHRRKYWTIEGLVCRSPMVDLEGGYYTHEQVNSTDCDEDKYPEQVTHPEEAITEGWRKGERPALGEQPSDRDGRASRRRDQRAHKQVRNNVKEASGAMGIFSQLFHRRRSADSPQATEEEKRELLVPESKLVDERVRIILTDESVEFMLARSTYGDLAKLLQPMSNHTDAREEQLTEIADNFMRQLQIIRDCFMTATSGHRKREVTTENHEIINGEIDQVQVFLGYVFEDVASQFGEEVPKKLSEDERRSMNARNRLLHGLVAVTKEAKQALSDYHHANASKLRSLKQLPKQLAVIFAQRKQDFEASEKPVSDLTADNSSGRSNALYIAGTLAIVAAGAWWLLPAVTAAGGVSTLFGATATAGVGMAAPAAIGVGGAGAIVAARISKQSQLGDDVAAIVEAIYRGGRLEALETAVIQEASSDDSRVYGRNNSVAFKVAASAAADGVGGAPAPIR